MLTLLIHASITFLVILDPIGLAPIFAGLTVDRTQEDRRHIALTGVLVAAGVLFVFALAVQFIIDGVHAVVSGIA